MVTESDKTFLGDQLWQLRAEVNVSETSASIFRDWCAE
jgi:hypothetical protein